MNKVLKYKILHTLEDKKFIVLVLAYILMFNYEIIISSGVLTLGDEAFNALMKHDLLMNNFIIISLSFGLFVSIYLGMSIIGKDIEINQMYILLTNIHSRKQYIFISWFSMVIIMIGIHIIININLLCVELALGIKLNFAELLLANKEIILNILVLLSITAFFVIALEGYIGGIGGIFALIIYNIHTYENIPLFNIQVMNLPEPVKRIMFNLVPLKAVQLPSTIENGNAYLLDIPLPYIINNIELYQVVFVIIAVLLMIYVFEKKDL